MDQKNENTSIQGRVCPVFTVKIEVICSKTAQNTNSHPDDDGSIVYAVNDINVIEKGTNESNQQKYQQPGSDLATNKFYNTYVQEHDGKNVHYILSENR